MLLLIRLVPYLAAFAVSFLSWFQYRHPSTYPWFSALGCGIFLFSVILISWRRLSLQSVVEKMIPSFLLQLSTSFGLLLVETSFAVWTIHLIAGISALLSLELLFLLAFEPHAYPVSGLSRLNIAFVPIIVWYVVSTSSGVMTFLHTPHLAHVVVCAFLGFVLFRTTGHPGATKAQNRIWSIVGCVVGLHIGWLGLHIPLNMPLQGAIAAALFSVALRMRRYVYAPMPSRQTAWIEAISVSAFFLVAMSTAKWL